MKEIRRRTRVVGAFPDGKSALMLVAARLRHIAGTKWGLRRYLDMDRLYQPQETEEAAGRIASKFFFWPRCQKKNFQSQGEAKSNVRNLTDTTLRLR